MIRLLRILYKNDPAIINLKAEKGGALRIHRINNVSAALQFLESRLNHQYKIKSLSIIILYRLYNIGAVDIVDGNSTSILGLLWIIILKLQIQSSLAGILDPQSLNPVKASGFDESKNNLLKWINQILKGRSLGVVDGFSCTTWKTGLHFANLLRSKNENLVPHYEQILQDVDRPGDNNEAWTRNLHLLFNIAEKSLNIPRLLDPIDLVQGKVEEKSLVTYISQFVDVLSSSTGIMFIFKSDNFSSE